MAWFGQHAESNADHFETSDNDIPLADTLSAFQDVYGSFRVLPDPQGWIGLSVLLLVFVFRHLVNIR